MLAGVSSELAVGVSVSRGVADLEVGHSVFIIGHCQRLRRCYAWTISNIQLPITNDEVDRYAVGVTGFEPATPCAQGRCANRTALHPEVSFVPIEALPLIDK